jgi:hypothetical protein
MLAPPSGTDLAAQHARAVFAGRHPGAAVDFRWYGGTLPAAYSVVAPYVEAVVGVRLSGALAALGSAPLLAVLLVRWRARRPVWAAALGAAAMVADLVSGRTAFALGLAVGLGALVAVPVGRSRLRRWLLPVGLAALTTLTSPVAALFLALVALAWSLRRRAVAGLAAATAVPMAVLAVAFHEPGHMPFTWPVERPLLIAAAAVALVCRGLPVRAAAVAYAIGTLLVFETSGPIGSNVERLALLFTPVVLVASAHVPRLVLALSVVVAGQWTVRVPVRDISNAGQITVEQAASHRLVGVLRSLEPTTGRVEVVPFLDHGEADVVAQAWPLARGWERQVDTVRAAPLYRGSLTPARYLAWLRANAVEYVALGRHRHDWSAAAELRLLRAPPPWLSVVHQDAEWTVWRVLGARPIVAAPATLRSIGPDRLVIETVSSGDVEIAVRWSRWLSTSAGSCIAPGADGASVMLHVRQAGVVTLGSSYLAPITGHHC